MRRIQLVSLVVVGALIGALAAPFGVAGAATAATLQPSGLQTGMQIDGDKTGGTPPNTFDWNSFLSAPQADGTYSFTPTGSYTTAQGNRSTGILDAKFEWDNGTLADACESTTLDATGSPGSQTPNTNPWAPGPQNTNAKGDLCSTASAYEVVADAQGVRHAVLYSYWTRAVGNGSLSVLQVLEGAAVGRCDDVMVVFDYDSSTSTATMHTRAWVPSAGDACANPNGTGAWVSTGRVIETAWAVGVRAEGPPLGNQSQATFGEFAVDLTAAGLLSPTQCSSFRVTTALTRTGADFTAQTQDYFLADDPLVIANCGALTVTKRAVPADVTSTDRFPYAVARVDGGIVLPATAATSIQDDLGIGETDTFSGVLSATDYRLSEVVSGPWAQQSLVCTTAQPGTGALLTFVLDDPSDTFPVYPSSRTDCVITNAISTVTVTKQTLPDGSTQPFVFDIGGNPAALSDGQSATFTFAPGSTVDITETIPDGWMAGPDIVCTDAGAVISESDAFAEVTTVAGADVQCTFTNTQLGDISISKEAIGTDPNTSFEFTGTWPGGETFSINAEVGDGTNYYQDFTGIPPGHYTVSETGDRHGTLIGSLICTIGGVDTVFPAGTTAAEFDLAPGDTVTCYFVNVVPGHILVVKETDPFEYDQDFLFDFGPAGEDPTDQFTLNPRPGFATWDSPSLPAGSYDITELLSDLPDWELTDITCDVSDGGSSTVDLETLTATVDLPDQGIAQCVFHNTAARGTLNLSKTVTGLAGGTPWSFDFAFTGSDGSSQSVTVSSADPSVSFTQLVPGVTYSLDETLPAGWDGTLTCGLADAATTLGWQFTLAPGDEITCTAENTAAPASVSVAKTVTGVTDDLPWEFDFTLTPPDGVLPAGGVQTISGTGPTSQTATWTSLLPGQTYTIAEQAEPGWAAGELTCTGIEDADTDPLTVTFVAQPGQALECAITNEPESIDISITKTALAGDGTFQFILTPLDPVAPALVSSVLTADGTGVATFTGLAPRGLYSLVEREIPGWVQGELACTVTHADGASEPLDVTGFRVAPGDQIACGIENTATPATLSVTKIVTDVPDGFAWSFPFALTPADGVTPDGGTQAISGTGPSSETATWTGLRPGRTYTITEQPVPGWQPSPFVCEGVEDSDDDPASVTFIAQAGTSFDCVIANAPDPVSVTIDKSTVAGDGTFDFVLTPTDPAGDPIDASVTTVDGAGTTTLDDVPPGRYTLTESGAAGWVAGDLACTLTRSGETSPADAADLDLQPGDALACGIQNTATGRIVVVKDVDGDDGTFDFTGGWLDPEDFSITTADGTGSATFEDVAPGSYELAEVARDGFDATALACADGDADGTASTVDDLVGAVNVDPGETVVCTFTNTQWGSLIVDKTTLPAGSTQEFAFEWGPDGEEFALTDAADPYSTGLIAPGTYTVTETSTLDGWQLGAIQCTGADGDPVVDGPSVTVDVPLQGTVFCTFVNAYRAPLEIEKTVSSGPTLQDDGTYVIGYTVTVANPGGVADVYDLDDALRFGEGVTVTAASVTSADGVTVDPSWNGLDAVRVTSGATIEAGDTHAFAVTATVTVASTITPEQADCNRSSETEGTGLLNTAMIAFTDGDASTTACAPVPPLEPPVPPIPPEPPVPPIPPVPPVPPLPPTGMTLDALWLGLALLAGGVAVMIVRRRRHPRTASDA
ncbi:prealbumin-like fold domain-containing protein [Microbacterium jejuense]|uniref:prealbumin-like fold domain-containing protein n=1 Tax=Microbacterium jejuense TaxID=1263637 RepID=UPI0031F1C174